MESSINMEEKIVWIIDEMADYLNISQIKNCRKFCFKHFQKIDTIIWYFL